MEERDLLSFLEANEVPERAKANVLAAEDRKRAFSNYLGAKASNEAGATMIALRDTLSKQSVFIPADLYSQFDTALTRLQGVLAEQSMGNAGQPRADQVDLIALIKDTKETMFEDLRGAVRVRLLSVGPKTS